MTKRKTVALALGSTLAVLYGFGTAAVNAAPAMPKPLVAEKAAKAAPDVAFTDAEGARHTLKEYRGKYVLLNMWATWCAGCVAELPALAKLKAAAPNITLLAVDLTGKRETPAIAAAFLKSHKAESLGTAVDTDVTFMRKFLTPSLPVTVLIDPSGKIVARSDLPAEWASPAFVSYFKGLK